MTPAADVVLLPDAGPLITLAYADALDLLFTPGWQVTLADMVLHEVTRTHTPTSERLASWAQANRLPVLPTRIYQSHLHSSLPGATPARKANLGELAIQECMQGFAFEPTPRTGVFLFEDHRIARTSFVVPDNCRKVSTRAFLLFLEQQGLIPSTAEVERRAVLAGRAFSSMRFPPG